MPDESQTVSFAGSVYPAELEEIRRRRAAAGLPLPQTTPGSGPRPDAGLTGLAISGGGIRSAAFSLGAVQQLITDGLFHRFDYLSTVSGGGWTGSCLSSLLHRDPDGAELLVARRGVSEAKALQHLRNCANYLVANSALGGLRIPATFIRGVLQVLLMVLPLIVGLLFATEVLIELATERLGLVTRVFGLVTLVPFLVYVFLLPLLGTVFGRRRGWAWRDRLERYLVRLLILAVAGLVMTPILHLVAFLVNHGENTVVDQLASTLGDRTATIVWAVVTVVLLALLLLGRSIAVVGQIRSKLLLRVVGLLGPAFLLLLYLAGCVFFINSPYFLPGNHAGQDIFTAKKLVPAAADFAALVPDETPADQRQAAVELLQQSWSDTIERQVLEMLEEDYVTADYEYDAEKSTSERLIFRLKDAAAEDESWFGRVKGWLATGNEPVLTIDAIPRATERDGARRMFYVQELALLNGNAEWWLYLLGLLLFLYNGLFANINDSSQHPYWRDRLSHAFLIEFPDGELRSTDRLRFSELNQPGTTAPYHLVNTALNLQGSNDPGLRDRKTVPFVLAKRFCGAAETGYAPTAEIEERDPQFNLATGMATSAAAASPNMGTLTTPSLVFVSTMLNIRLNYWLPNPRWRGIGASWLTFKPGLKHLLAEAFGRVDAEGPYVNLSDGGHIENLAVYELLRRRCSVIVCVDGEADPLFRFGGLTTLMRYAEIDMGVHIDIDVNEIRPGQDGLSSASVGVGSIDYGHGEFGTFVYLKLSYSGTEAEYVRHYRDSHPTFPHQSTADQFFDETQFEVYRALGSHVAAGITDRLRSVLEG